MPRYRLKIVRWDCYVIRHVEARSEDEAEERAVDVYEHSIGSEQIDGGYKLVEAELEDE